VSSGPHLSQPQLQNPIHMSERSLPIPLNPTYLAWHKGDQRGNRAGSRIISFSLCIPCLFINVDDVHQSLSFRQLSPQPARLLSIYYGTSYVTPLVSHLVPYGALNQKASATATVRTCEFHASARLAENRASLNSLLAVSLLVLWPNRYLVVQASKLKARFAPTFQAIDQGLARY
jgi:hypothetical protein